MVIDGQLACIKGRFENLNDTALNGQKLRVKSHVFLSNDFHATGEVDLKGMEIGGELVCTRGCFENSNGTALDGQGLKITAGFFWRQIKSVNGKVKLRTAYVGVLHDDEASWEKVSKLSLDGFCYDRIIAGSFTNNSEARLKWLKKGAIRKDETGEELFCPQPYGQYAKIMREMGHDRTARKVQIAREKKINKYSRQETLDKANSELGKQNILKEFYHVFGGIFVSYIVRWIIDFLFRWVIGYGYDVKRSFWFLLGLFFLLIPLAHYTWESGGFAPNSDVILTSREWAGLDDKDLSNTAQAWTQEATAGKDWNAFNRYAWAADVVIPLIEFGQTNAWIPSTERGVMGYILWVAQWVFGFCGWVIAVLMAAGLSGYTRRD